MTLYPLLSSLPLLSPSLTGLAAAIALEVTPQQLPITPPWQLQGCEKSEALLSSNLYGNEG
eukprot:767311-Hanusia_phi.AAC.5